MGPEDLHPDPIVQLARWLDEARAARVHEPEAMVLATASAEGRPDARFVLLRGLDARGLAFYTNYESAKARQLAENPRAAVVFGWGPLQRQVRVSGAVERVPPEESDAYFSSRARGSRIGAWASPQSRALSSREELDARVAEIEARFADHDLEIPRPPHWGGFRLAPAEVELWQGRPNRLHDRVRYRRADGGAWIRERLAP